jgi:hypothetical protein
VLWQRVRGELERMQTQIDRFRQMLEHRAAVLSTRPENSRIWRTLSEIMVGLTALMFLFVLGFILKRRVLYPGRSPERRGAASRLPGLCGRDAALYPDG